MGDFGDNARRASDLDLDISMRRHRSDCAAQAARAPAFNRNGIRICIGCDNLIDIARVRAVPGVVRCIECQRVYESGE